MRNNIFVNHDTLRYFYEDDGKLSIIHFINEVNVIYRNVFFLNQGAHIKEILWNGKNENGDFIVDRIMTFSYSGDNVTSIREQRRAPINDIVPCHTSIRTFENSDHKQFVTYTKTFTMHKNKSLLILVAGPYRSGTNDNPELIEANVKAMTDTALTIYKMGHMPVLGEWFALPLIRAAGSKQVGDEIFNDIFHPIAVKLINHCDAVLRMGGASAGANEMVKVAQEKGKIVFFNKTKIPAISEK